jgi:putative flippase GtrA
MTAIEPRKKYGMKKIIKRAYVFAKAQLSAFIGGMVDYLCMILFTEVFHVHYPVSVAIGGVIGAIANFLLNKIWTFRSKEQPYKYSGKRQLLRFGIVVANSILLKASGTFLFTEFLKINYVISRLITDLFVSIAFNYTLQSRWVFKKETQ